MKSYVIVIGIIFFSILSGCISPLKNDSIKVPKPSVTISSDTIWPAKGIYHITCDLYLEAFLAVGDSSSIVVDSSVVVYVNSHTANPMLTIGKGTKLYFGKYAGIQIGENGSFIAHGNPTSPITFTRDSSTDVWGSGKGGIFVNGYGHSTGQVSLKHCIIEYATIGLNDSCTFIELSHSTVKNCLHEGVVFNDWGGPKDSASFLHNVITENGSYPLTIRDVAYVGNLSGTGDFSGNAKDGILIFGGGIYPYTVSVWKKHNVPYVVKSVVRLSGTSPDSLIVRPGCRIEFDSGQYNGMEIGWACTFIAIGTESEPIVFTKEKSVQNWAGVRVDDVFYGQANFKHCVIEYANTGITAGAPITVSNCSIKNCRINGIEFTKTRNFNGQIAYGCPKDSSSFLNNVITGNGSYAITIYADRVGYLPGSGTFTGNGADGILVHGDIVAKSALWKNHDVPFVIDNCVDIGSAAGTIITIEPGCRFKFTKIGSYIQVGNTNEGTLIASGLPTDSIVFSNLSETIWWGFASAGLRIGNYATSSTSLRYCDISYATNGVYVDAAVSIQNCFFHDNRQYGIYLSKTGIDGRIMDNTFSNNILGEIYQ
ncbi:MAG: hypothetical protein JW915_01795 [Chitinispirillaceae bacterium]|nr:hypothetical protein [Chitinispirillaceae bacterium]